MAIGDIPRSSADSNPWMRDSKSSIKQGAATENFNPVTVSLEEYLTRVDGCCSGLVGFGEAIEEAKRSLGEEEAENASAFHVKLSTSLEKQQALKDELGIHIGTLRKHLQDLLSPDFVPGNIRIGSGIFGENIGDGGMGSLRKAVIRGRLKATKKLLNPGNPDLVQRFLKEQAALQKLDGNIGPQFDGVETVNGERYIIMDWIDGENLAAFGRLPPEQAYDVLASFAAAAANLVNDYKIFHRDIKPQNVMVNRRTGEVKIIDFGIMAIEGENGQSDTAGENKTREGHVMGTPAFMSPQMLQDSSKLDERNEAYAVGATAYFLLTGKNPDPGNPDLSLLPVEVRGWIEELTRRDINQRKSINEAGKFAFENSGHTKLFGTWEEFLQANNARRTIDPTQLYSGGQKIISLPRKSNPSSRFWTSKKTVITGLSAVALTALGVIVMAGRNTDEKPINGEKKGETKEPVVAKKDDATLKAEQEEARLRHRLEQQKKMLDDFFRDAPFRMSFEDGIRVDDVENKQLLNRGAEYINLFQDKNGKTVMRGLVLSDDAAEKQGYSSFVKGLSPTANPMKVAQGKTRTCHLLDMDDPEFANKIREANLRILDVWTGFAISHRETGEARYLAYSDIPVDADHPVRVYLEEYRRRLLANPPVTITPGKDVKNVKENEVAGINRAINLIEKGIPGKIPLPKIKQELKEAVPSKQGSLRHNFRDLFANSPVAMNGMPHPGKNEELAFAHQIDNKAGVR